MSHHSTIPSTDRMAQVLRRLYLARKARREAREAFSRYLAAAWNETDPDEDGPGGRDPKAHRYACCQLPMLDEDTPQLCPVCAGSAPFHAAYLLASREAGSALRQAQAWGKRFAEQGVAFPPAMGPAPRSDSSVQMAPEVKCNPVDVHK